MDCIGAQLTELQLCLSFHGFNSLFTMVTEFSCPGSLHGLSNKFDKHVYQLRMPYQVSGSRLWTTLSCTLLSARLCHEISKAAEDLLKLHPPQSAAGVSTLVAAIRRFAAMTKCHNCEPSCHTVAKFGHFDICTK